MLSFVESHRQVPAPVTCPPGKWAFAWTPLRRSHSAKGVPLLWESMDSVTGHPFRPVRVSVEGFVAWLYFILFICLWLLASYRELTLLKLRTGGGGTCNQITFVSWFNCCRGIKCKVCVLEKVHWVTGIGGVFPIRHGFCLHVRELVGLWVGSIEPIQYCNGTTSLQFHTSCLQTLKQKWNSSWMQNY